MTKFFQNKFFLVSVSIVLIAMVVFLVWQNFQQSTPTNSFQTASVTKGNLVKSISASGSIISAGSLIVTTPASGIVSQLFITPGQNVTVGQKLAEIQLDQKGIKNRDSLWSKYLAAKTSLESSKLQIAPANTISQNQTDLNLAWKAYNDALGLVTAPVAGQVVDLKVVAGLPLNNTGDIVTIQSAKEVFSVTSVSEMDISQVKFGQKVAITIPAMGGKSFTGKVVAIDSRGISKSGVIHYPVTVSIDNPPVELLTNMSADVKFILAEKDNTLIVPLGALQSNNGKDVVNTLKNGKLVEVNVKIGLTNDTSVEILSGLALNDVVVTGTTSASQSTPGSTSIFNGLTNPSGSGLVVPGGGSNN